MSEAETKVEEKPRSTAEADFTKYKVRSVRFSFILTVARE